VVVEMLRELVDDLGLARGRQPERRHRRADLTPPVRHARHLMISDMSR
jgi:hypothetical protein